MAKFQIEALLGPLSCQRKLNSLDPQHAKKRPSGSSQGNVFSSNPQVLPWNWGGFGPTFFKQKFAFLTKNADNSVFGFAFFKKLRF